MRLGNRQARRTVLTILVSALGFLCSGPFADAQYRPDWIWSRATRCGWQVAVSPDGTQIAAADGMVVKLWRASDRVLEAMFPLSDTARCVAYARDGGSVIVGEGSRLTRRSLPYGDVIWNIPVTGQATCVDVSADGTRVVTGHPDGRMRIWQVADGAFVLQSTDALPSTVDQVGFTPDGSNVFVSSYGHLRAWNANTGGAVYTLASAGLYLFFAISPDGTTLATNINGALSLYAISDGSPLGSYPCPTVTGLAFSPDGSRLCGESIGGTISETVTATIWQTSDWTLLHSVQLPVQVRQGDGFLRRPAWIPGTSRVVIPFEHLEVVDADTGLREALDRCHVGTVPGVAIAGDGSTLVTMARDWTIRTWDAATGATIGSMQMHDGGSSYSPYVWKEGDLSLTPDGQHAAAWCGNGVQIWDVLGQALVRDFGYGNTVAMAADGQSYVLARDNYGAWIERWELSGTLLWESLIPGSTPRGMSCSPNNVVFAVGTTWGSYQNLYVRYLADCSEHWTRGYYPASATCFSPDGSSLAMRFGLPAYWYVNRTVDGSPVAYIGPGKSAGVFTRDGRYFVVSSPTDVTFYSTVDWKPRRVYNLDVPQVLQIAFSPDGSRMFVGTFEGTVRCANMEPFAEIAVSPAAGTPGQTVALTASLTDNGAPVVGRELRFFLNGIAIGSANTNESGIATRNYVIQEADLGTNTLTVVFDGDAGYGNYRNEGTLTVTKAATSTYTLDRTGTITEPVLLRAYLKRVTDNLPLEGRTIAFRVAGTSVGSAITGATGRADLSWVITSGPATRTIAVEFAGDATYNGSSGTATLTAQTHATKMYGADREGRITAYRILKAWLYRTDSTPVVGKSIAFKVDGTNIGSALTVTGGRAQVGYTIADGSGAGVRQILAEWVGDGGYLPSSATNTLTVSKAIPYIWVMPRSVAQGGVARMYAYFRRLADYQKQEGKTVSFRVDGTWIADAVTGTGADAGIARYLYITVEPVGVHTIRCEFAGDAWVDAGYGEANLTIY